MVNNNRSDQPQSMLVSPHHQPLFNPQHHASAHVVAGLNAPSYTSSRHVSSFGGAHFCASPVEQVQQVQHGQPSQSPSSCSRPMLRPTQYCSAPPSSCSTPTGHPTLTSGPSIQPHAQGTPIPSTHSHPSSPTCSLSPRSFFSKCPGSLKRSTTMPQKKPTRSTLEKRSAVQLSLELKVEKAKGFLVIPLGRPPPPAPPSSPILAPAAPLDAYKLEALGQSQWDEISSAPVIPEIMPTDYFGGWETKLDAQEWVEHPAQSMDVDLH
ncbi:hypothetical protein BD324DRAFT_615988 [Kockovaella imperatae]|uniref:Uncharacterized protein n=1 Tax=Kockovaella imperatae TaxID=4999 RepID=A0A1Y1US69_9TREE|nr:hypothetical protein BD324DRAFT_615988 [Kockovaella imperatae]ORX40025.1 hypothetical protein BD324DRAFT_615988 [Kockovaella imperatae]